MIRKLRKRKKISSHENIGLMWKTLGDLESPLLKSCAKLWVLPWLRNCTIASTLCHLLTTGTNANQPVHVEVQRTDYVAGLTGLVRLNLLACKMFLSVCFFCLYTVIFTALFVFRLSSVMPTLATGLYTDFGMCDFEPFNSCIWRLYTIFSF